MPQAPRAQQLRLQRRPKPPEVRPANRNQLSVLEDAMKKEDFQAQRRPQPPEFHAGTGKHGLQATLSSPQAPQALQNKSCRHACAGCRHPLPPRGHRRPSLRGLQASLPSSQAPQARENMGCKHPLPRRSHRWPGKMWVAGIFAFVAGTANASNHGLQACLRGLQACRCGSQASQTLQITGAGMPARLEF